MAIQKVLSIDGGGIRGVFAAALLERIEQQVPSLRASVTLYAGTSTGGLIALELATGTKTPTDLVQLYKTKGPEIFDDSWLDDLRDLGGLAGADYDNKNLKKILTKEFGQTRLKDLPTRVLISAFDLDNEAVEAKREWKPKFFHNFAGTDSDGGELAVDVALRTAAAPTQFPSYDGYVDGGVVANNPSMAALAQLLDDRASGGAAAKLNEIRLFSLGTGTPLHYIPGKTHDWGYAQWVKPLIKLMLDGSVGVADYQCHQLLGARYHRLAPKFPPKVAIGSDDVKRIPELIKLAKDVDIAPSVNWLKANW